MLILDEVGDANGLRALERDWQRLFQQAPEATPFQSWEWQSSWWTHLGGGKPWLLVARDRAGVVGLMPLVVTRYAGTSLKQVRWIGAPHSDYQDPLCEAGREAECARAFVAHLYARRDRWDLCDLNDLRTPHDGCPGSPLLDVAGGLDGLGEPLFHRRCPAIALAASWPAFLAGMKRKLRSNVTRRARRIREWHRVELDTVADRALLPAAMSELFALHNRRWRRRGVLGAFSGVRIQRFHREVADRFLSSGILRLHRLRLDGRTCAAFYCFQLRQRVYYYLGGFDVAFHRLGPGQLLMAYAIERAIADGATELDLLRGDEAYKYDWGAVDRLTLRMVLGHRSLRSRLGMHLHQVERYFEHRGLDWQRRLWGQPARGLSPSPPA